MPGSVTYVSVALAWLAPAHADKWLPPKPTTYESLSAGAKDEEYVEQGGQFRIIRIHMKTGQVLRKDEP
jgi:hypothetical protein